MKSQNSKNRLSAVGYRLSAVVMIAFCVFTVDAQSVDSVPMLDPSLLVGVRDDQPFGNWEQALPLEVPAEARDEDAIYWKAVIFSSITATEAFARAAEQNRHLTFGHLYGEPAKYRGQVVHIEGRLVRLKQLDPPRHAPISVLYEAWIYLDQPGTHPVCVVLAHKPAGIELGDNLNRRVAVDGYFFKRYGYLSGRLDSAGNNVALNTILLIAQTAALQERPIAIGSTALGAGWYWLGGLVIVGAVLTLAMTWWFRHNDRQIQTQVQSFCRPALAAATFDKPLPNPNTCRT
ncbi:MAG TPA: hypothetical protein VE988_30295 [Gemmataceae bacterium]|nr:hypothetical protein [Gemmataceae bacterium]